MRQIILLLAMIAGVAGPLRAQETIVTEGIIDSPDIDVWRAWTTTAGLKAWLAPHADIDLRLEGRMRANYDAKGTLEDSEAIENRILAYEPERMLSIRVQKPPKDFQFRDRVGDMWTVMYFESTPDNKTVLRIVGLGFTADSDSQKMKAFFKRGNDYTLVKLQEHFKP